MVSSLLSRLVHAGLVLGLLLATPVAEAAPEGAPGTEPSARAPTDRAAFRGVELTNGRRIAGRVLEVRRGEFVLVQPDEPGAPAPARAVEWSLVARIDGAAPPPVPPPGAGSIIPPGFSPERVTKLVDAGKKASDVLPGLVAPANGTQLIGSIQGAQDVLELVGLKRGPPNGFMVGYALVMMPLCFEMTRGTFGRIDGTGFFGAGCSYVLTPLSAAMLVLAPFMPAKVEEMKGPSVHHVNASVYALDYSKKSALTGALQREPSGGFLGNNLGYDLGYTYIGARSGLVGYGHMTLQQTSIARTDYLQVSSMFYKADAQIGFDAVRFLSKGDPSSYWSQHSAYVRGGPSFFHNWILSRDVGSRGAGASVDNPLNNSLGLSTGLGYELAAEIDFRFPQIAGWSTGGLHLQLERGSYPVLSFPALSARDGAFIALIGFDDLRQGSTYTWQRLKAELELPLDFSRRGGVFLGGQLASYENNFGSGVDNRGLSLDYRWRFD